MEIAKLVLVHLTVLFKKKKRERNLGYMLNCEGSGTVDKIWECPKQTRVQSHLNNRDYFQLWNFNDYSVLVIKSRVQNFTDAYNLPMEKEMATHSSILA